MTVKRMMLVIITKVSFSGIPQGTGYVVKAFPYNHPHDKVVFFDRDDAQVYAFDRAEIVKVCGSGSYQYFLDRRYYASVTRLRDERTKEFFWRLKLGQQGASFKYPNFDLAEKKLIEKIANFKPDLVVL